jgi:hypothetical protein
MWPFLLALLITKILEFVSRRFLRVALFLVPKHFLESGGERVLFISSWDEDFVYDIRTAATKGTGDTNNGRLFHALLLAGSIVSRL